MALDDKVNTKNGQVNKDVEDALGRVNKGYARAAAEIYAVAGGEE